ncbi:ATP-dependent zinc protease family protein [Arenimonas composti]|uniref:ATP-dependent zinc protease family protein n=1 Tax=Arenimonas composti TaxID=370776 RepID=UPI00041F679C|nr:RimK/LysX family protein [Arenimonas composti]
MSQLVRLGWREWLALPDLGIPGLRVKVDTGARSSALHVLDEAFFRRDGREFVRFSVEPRAGATPLLAEAEVLDRRVVTDSGGHRTERTFIRTRLQLAGQAFVAEVNLARRRNMLFPMLLGRTALAGRFVVDPAGSFLFGEGTS